MQNKYDHGYQTSRDLIQQIIFWALGHFFFSDIFLSHFVIYLCDQCYFQETVDLCLIESLTDS